MLVFTGLFYFQLATASDMSDRVEAVTEQLRVHQTVNNYLMDQGFSPEGNLSQGISKMEEAKQIDSQTYGEVYGSYKNNGSPQYVTQSVRDVQEYRQSVLDACLPKDDFLAANKKGNQAKHKW
jgi:hypothetical protein